MTAGSVSYTHLFYGIGVITTYAYNRIMVNVTQGTLRNLRVQMFEKMETLPIKYFDTNAHGDIMSTYTNDIDTLRQMISQSIPPVSYTHLDTPEGVMEDGYVKDKDRMAQLLREQMKDNGVKEKEVVFSIASSKMCIRDRRRRLRIRRFEKE